MHIFRFLSATFLWFFSAVCQLMCAPCVAHLYFVSRQISVSVNNYAKVNQSTCFFSRKKSNLFSFFLFILVLWRVNLLHPYIYSTAFESEQFQYENINIMQLLIASSGQNSEGWLLGTLSVNSYQALSENKFINNEIKFPKGIYILASKDKGQDPNKEREVTMLEHSIFVFKPAQQASTCGHVDCVQYSKEASF